MRHLLLTNDDGIDAPGLQALNEAAKALAEVRISVVAPAHEQSQCGHRVTTYEALRVEDRGEGRHAVHGTPADCVRIALFALELKPDLVLSGINQGGNLGQDIVISGTVAAAREACYHGVSAMAVSQYLRRGQPLDWNDRIDWLRPLIEGLLTDALPPAQFLNVNLPHLDPGCSRPDVVDTLPAHGPLPVEFKRQGSSGIHTDYHYTGSYPDRPRDPGSDVEACFGGAISRSVLQL